MTALAASLPLAGLPVRFRAGLTAALAAGLAYLLLSPMLDGTENVVLKGSGVTLLALSALQLRTDGERWLAAIMALGALGDVLLALPGLFIAGAASFAAGHLVAIIFYARHRRAVGGRDWLMAALLLLFGLAMPPLLTPAGLPCGQTLLYAVLLTAMAASLWLSRFPRLAALGAIAFVLSDTILVLRLGGPRERARSLAPRCREVLLRYAAAQGAAGVRVLDECGEPVPRGRSGKALRVVALEPQLRGA
jgi:uncharacterized membrane protein YhhN